MNDQLTQEQLVAMQLRAGLAIKIASFSKTLGAIKEDGTNQHSKYKFISSNQMLALMRERMGDHHLAIIPEVTGNKEDQFQSQKGAQVTRTILEIEFEIIDLETGYSITKKFMGADQDQGGKSFAQAITETTKRFYFKLFHVSSAEDKDPDSKTTEAYAATITQEEAGKLVAQMQAAGENYNWIWGLIMTKYQIQDIAFLPAGKFAEVTEEIKTALEKRIANQGA